MIAVGRPLGRVVAMALVMVGVSAPSASAAAGEPDRTFGGDGVVSVPVGGIVPALVGLRDGGVAGASGDGNDRLQLFRLLADGSIDTTFGDSGTTTLKVGQYPTAATVLEMDDASIVVVGGTLRRHGPDASSEHFDPMVARFTPSGALDASFSGDGRAFVDFGQEGSASAAYVDPSGGLMVVGSGDERLLLTRLRPDGFRDRSFGLDGKIDVRVPGQIHEMAVDGSGRIVVGYSVDRHIVLRRFLADGRTDETFARRPTPIKGFLQGLQVDGAGRIIALGMSHGRVAVARFTPTGAPDTTFHDDGWRTFSIGRDPSAVDAVAQPNGRIVVGVSAGFSQDDLDLDVVLVRLTAGGRIDRSFGHGGVAITQLGGTDILRAMWLTQDRTLLTTGEADELSAEPGLDLFVMRTLLRL